MQAQAKYDYYWPLGKDQVIGPEFGALEFDFSKKPFTPDIRTGGLEFDRNSASICDKDGNLLFYTNGREVADKLHRIMPNGQDINKGTYLEEFWSSGGYPGRQDIIILPDPSNLKGYYIIHKPRSRDTISNENFSEIIQYSYVDMDMNQGFGDVEEKNVVFHLDSLLWSYLTVIGHYNRKDWWIMNPLEGNKGYVKYLLSTDGIQYSSTQIIGPVFHSQASAAGDAKFSPDGTKYAYFNIRDGLHVYDFDRETCELSNYRGLPPLDLEALKFATCEWSPNSRYVYIAISDSLWQVDTYENQLEDGRVFIAEYNRVSDPTSTAFFMSALGPDCRIYIRPGSSSFSFHVIHKPDEAGLACDFVQQALKLPSISARGSFPNFPRFRVDEEEKCDPTITSLFGEDILWRRDLTTYPNPMTDRLYVEIPEQTLGQLYVMDMQGQVLMYETNVRSNSFEMDVSGLPAGIYQVEFLPEVNKERVVYSTKMIKID